VFNLSGSEIIVILLLALVVLGPEKLPEALRRAGRTYAELKKMGNSFQSEMRSVLDEPMKEMRDTADLLRKAVDITVETATTDTRTAPTPSAEPVPEVAAAEAELAEAGPTAGTMDPAASGDPGAEPVPEVAAAEAELEQAPEPAASAPAPATAEALIGDPATNGTDPAPAPATNGTTMDAAPTAPTVTSEDELINRTLSGGS
jgi:sec-independent protein translocase protein TatB